MKLKIKTNFSFNKLAKQMPDVINNYLKGYAKDSVKGTRNNIDRRIGNDGTPLKLGRGSYREGKKALFNTGKMYKTLKSKGNALSIKEYGFKHHKGQYPVKADTNVKDFIGTTEGNKKKIDKEFIKNVNKALKK